MSSAVSVGSALGAISWARAKQQLGYERIVAHRFAINPNLSVRSRRNRALQLQLPRYYRLGEITFADEIRDDENLANRLDPRKKIARRAGSVPLSKKRIGHRQKLCGAEFRARVSRWVRSNLDSRLNRDRQ